MLLETPPRPSKRRGIEFLIYKKATRPSRKGALREPAAAGELAGLKRARDYLGAWVLFQSPENPATYAKWCRAV